MLLKHEVGWPVEGIAGFGTSTADVLLGIERGEVDGMVNFYNSLLPFLEAGTLKVVARAGTARDLPGHVVQLEEILTERQKAYLRVRYAEIGVPMYVPRGTPLEIVNIFA